MSAIIQMIHFCKKLNGIGATFALFILYIFQSYQIETVCYIHKDLVSSNEIRQLCDLGVKTPHIMCRACVDNSDIDMSLSGAWKNKKHEKQ